MNIFWTELDSAKSKHDKQTCVSKQPSLERWPVLLESSMSNLDNVGENSPAWSWAIQ